VVYSLDLITRNGRAVKAAGEVPMHKTTEEEIKGPSTIRELIFDLAIMKVNIKTD
jgi:hypothetical protein